jgi:hypothetical protein
MLQIRPYDLLAVKHRDEFFLFAVLTKQILFGGHWVFVFHEQHPTLPAPGVNVAGLGFNVAVDFLRPAREQRLHRLSRKNDFQALRGPDWLQQEPLPGDTEYQIWKWIDGSRERADLIRRTPSPTEEERSAPHYTCLQADFACELARRKWRECQSINIDLPPSA